MLILIYSLTDLIGFTGENYSRVFGGDRVLVKIVKIGFGGDCKDRGSSKDFGDRGFGGDHRDRGFVGDHE